MIRLGLRLTLKGGKEAAARLVMTTAAVALGVGMLLITLAGINAVNAQNGRYAWLGTGAGSQSQPRAAGMSGTGAAPAAADPLWWLLTADKFHGQVVGRVDVAATGSHSPVPPGIDRLPGPGEFAVSPALGRLLRSTPAGELAARYPGQEAGTIGAAGLPARDSLIIVVGHRPDQLSHVPGAELVTSISTTTPSSCNGDCYFIGIDASGIDLILSVAAAAMLFPVLIFIGTATRLSAARREQRFAAMRLVGATPRQVSVISAVESTVAAAAGVAAGFGLFFLLRPPLATIPFTGAPFFVSDLSLNLADVLLVALGVPAAAAVAARLALRRVQISPLGVTRRVTPSPPRAWRMIPLLAGIGELAYFVAAGRPKTTPGQIQAFLPGFLLILAGLVIAGPWLTMVGSRQMARRTRRASALIAGRRLSDNPQAGFRAISGLILALFVTSVAIGLITTIDARDGRARGSAVGPDARDTLVDRFTVGRADGLPARSIPSISSPVLAELRSIPGVRAVTLVHAGPAGVPAGASVRQRGGDGARSVPAPALAPGLVSCAELAATPALGRCPAGATAATIASEFTFPGRSNADIVWPAAALPAGRIQSLPVQSVAVATTGSNQAIERARTVLELAYPDRYFPATIGEEIAQSPRKQLNTQYRQLVNVVVVVSLVIGGCSLAVSVAGGLSDRKRPFSLLRLTGAPLGMLRRVVALESAVPLLVIALVSTGTGFLAAGLFARAQLQESLQSPGTEYYLIVLAGLAASLGVIASTLPLLERITGPDTARDE